MVMLSNIVCCFHFHYPVGILGSRAFRYFAPYSRDMVHGEKRFTYSTILTSKGIHLLSPSSFEIINLYVLVSTLTLIWFFVLSISHSKGVHILSTSSFAIINYACFGVNINVYLVHYFINFSC